MRIWIGVVGLVLLALAALAAVLGRVEGVRTEEVVIPADASGLMLRGRLYLPREEGARPSVLVCHGIGNAKENNEPLALALASRGFVVLAFDFGGHGESAGRPLSDKVNDEDARRAMAYLLTRPEADTQRLAGYGFSMGAIPIVEAVRGHDGVRAVVCVGHAVAVTADSPPNLLFGMGAYDQLVAPDTMRDALERATGERLDFGELYGSVAQGTARQAIISASSDHPLEPWDPRLMTESVRWIEEGTGMTAATPPAPLTWLLPVARAAAIVGSLLLLSLGMHWALGRLPAERLRSPLFRRLVAAAGAAVCAVPVVLSLVTEGHGTLLSDVALTLVLLLLAVDWMLFRHAAAVPPGTEAPSWAQTPRLAFVPVLEVAVIGLGAWIVASVLYRVGYLWQRPETLLSLPQLAAEEVAFLPGIGLPKLRMILFSEYSRRVVPSAVWYAALLLEVALPGTLLGVAGETVELAVRGVRWRKGDTPRPKAPFSWVNLVFRLLILGGVAAALVMAAVGQRSLDTPSFQKMAATLTWMVVLFVPVLLVLVRLTRRPWWAAKAPPSPPGNG